MEVLSWHTCVGTSQETEVQIGNFMPLTIGVSHKSHFSNIHFFVFNECITVYLRVGFNWYIHTFMECSFLHYNPQGFHFPSPSPFPCSPSSTLFIFLSDIYIFWWFTHIHRSGIHCGTFKYVPSIVGSISFHSFFLFPSLSFLLNPLSLLHWSLLFSWDPLLCFLTSH